MILRTCAALSCRDRTGMTCSGRGKSISGRPSVGAWSVGGRIHKISAKAGTTRLHGKAVGQHQKTQFREA
ncbi:hypothetical protein GPY37_23350 [Photorhabdus kayaii]|uniref:Uncharacterized protein n=3 Tax=Morganellaceae TaxID=1903414 RepID=A0ABX0B6M4_9GAMM|nr:MULTISPECIES: hypothetical protein [Photorhabdus]MCC8376411.1 hypothetical protein [Photorhabdus bodei]MDB6374066.1 hypothetical protein [Photorhabdus bodei]NDL14501.1 hypothetical protein [Photorhabdus kayaii]NDL27921.1 hypothetical protein [Photorhabdus kayaii]